MPRPAFDAIRQFYERGGYVKPRESRGDRERRIRQALYGSSQWDREGFASQGAVKPLIRRVGSEVGNRIGDLGRWIANKSGVAQGRRFEQAADLTNLERYRDSALKPLFTPSPPGRLTVMPPGDFERFAYPLGSEDRLAQPYMTDYLASRQQVYPNYSKYIEHLGDVANQTGFSQVPLLGFARTRDAVYPSVVQHSGRNRMRALDQLGDPSALVDVRPSTVEDIGSLKPSTYMNRLLGKYPEVIPQEHVWSSMFDEDAARKVVQELPPYFADGGRVGFTVGGEAAKRAGSFVGRQLGRFIDPAAERIANWTWRPLRDVAKDLGIVNPMTKINPGAEGYGRFMQKMADKAAGEGLSAEDLARAHQITTFSMGRGALPTSTVRKYWPDLPEHLQGDIRPEGAMAEWLRTPMGQQYARSVAQGLPDWGAVDQATRYLTGFGKQNEIRKVAERGASIIPGATNEASDLVARAARGESPPSEWHDFMDPFYGVRPAKHGFFGSLIGRGDRPTFDARQIVGQTGMSTKEAAPILALDARSREAVERLAARQRALRMDVPEGMEPFSQHLWHHDLWDRWGESPPGGTTHQDLIDAMSGHAEGGRIGFDVGGSAARELARKAGQALMKRIYGSTGDVTKQLAKTAEVNVIEDAARQRGQSVDELIEQLQRRKAGVKQWQGEDVTGFSSLMGRQPLEGATASYLNPDPDRWSRPLITPHDLFGGVGVSGMSDRTGAGRVIGSLLGNKLDKPLILSGGSDYPLYHPDLWASGQGPLTSMKNALQAKGIDPDAPKYYLNKLMGRELSADQSHMAQILAAHALEHAPITAENRALFEAYARNYSKSVGPKTITPLPGLPSTTRSSEMLQHLLDLPMQHRSGLLEAMDSAKFNKLGIPNPAAIRMAITDPALMTVPEGTVGRTVGRINMDDTFNPKPQIPHPSYPVGLRGEYMGGFDRPVPPDVIFPDWWKGRDPATADSRLRASWRTSPAIQVFDQKWLDQVMPKFEAIQERWHRGGGVPAFSRGGSVRDRELYHPAWWQEDWGAL